MWEVHIFIYHWDNGLVYSGVKSMAEKSEKTPQPEPAEAFQNERSSIVQDIKQFLFIALNFVHTTFQLNPGLDTDKSVEHVRGLIKSLCLIHALYGYPVANGKEEGKV